MSDAPALPRTLPLGPDEAGRVLASNADTVYLSIEVTWQTESLLIFLGELQAMAQVGTGEYPGEIKLENGSDTWRFTVLSHGTRGYAFVIDSREMTWKISASLEPNSRPNVVVEIRSEALWHLSPPACVERIRKLIEAKDGLIRSIKPSRIDLCADVLVRDEDFTEHLRPLFVTRACDIEPKFPNRKFSGFMIGHGQIKARLYDKPMEIRRKNKKFWMFPIWGLEVGHVPEGHRIVRVEFELRRERLKLMGMETIEDFFRLQKELWAYCTQKWLLLKDCPEKQSHRRKLLPLWKVVQAGFQGAETAHPLVRAMAMNQDRTQTYQQLFGQIARLIAIEADREKIGEDAEIDFTIMYPVITKAAKRLGITRRVMGDRVRRKIAKFEHASEAYKIAMELRNALHGDTNQDAQPQPEETKEPPP